MHTFTVKLRGLNEKPVVSAKHVTFDQNFVIFYDAGGLALAGFSTDLVANVQREDASPPSEK